MTTDTTEIQKSMRDYCASKLDNQKMKIVVSGPITSWEIDWETVEAVADFYLSGLQKHCRW